MRRLLPLFLAFCFGALAVSLAGCGGGDHLWKREGRIGGACCNYASLVITADGPRVYTNTSDSGKVGSLNLFGRTVLHIDAPADAFIRTMAVVEQGGKWFALLETGDAYPGSNGYSPSWATSPDGENWKWHGPVSPYPRTISSGAALTIDEQGHFRAWLDISGALHEMRSDDGLKWVDAGVVPLAGAGLFATAARTPTGTMLAVADQWPSSKVSLLWQCHGGEWILLDGDSVIHNDKDKGVALAYHAGQIHAYNNGVHWTAAPPACHPSIETP